MKELNSIGFRSPRALRRAAGLFAIVFSACTLIASDAVIDFRTFIPGVLDAPVYWAGGTNRLSGGRYFAELRVGSSRAAVAAVSPAITATFGEGEWAGYLGRDQPVPRVLPGFQAGDRVWFQLVAWELVPISPFGEQRFFGWSESFSLIVSNTPTPLVGLKSFSLSVPDLQIRRQGDQMVLRWSADDGFVFYDLETTESLGLPGSWRSSGLKPVLDGQQGWTDWVVTNSISQGTAYYRIKLVTPRDSTARRDLTNGSSIIWPFEVSGATERARGAAADDVSAR